MEADGYLDPGEHCKKQSIAVGYLLGKIADRIEALWKAERMAHREYVGYFDDATRTKDATIARLRAAMKEVRDAANTVIEMLELGDDRLLASDGPAGGQLPDLSPAEWGKVYRACKKLAARLREEAEK